ncbi:MAG: hypothetical protein D6766_06685, partial [Verrucomicrobia bacterium]
MGPVGTVRMAGLEAPGVGVDRIGARKIEPERVPAPDRAGGVEGRGEIDGPERSTEEDRDGDRVDRGAGDGPRRTEGALPVRGEMLPEEPGTGLRGVGLRVGVGRLGTDTLGVLEGAAGDGRRNEGRGADRVDGGGLVGLEGSVRTDGVPCRGDLVRPDGPGDRVEIDGLGDRPGNTCTGAVERKGV